MISTTSLLTLLMIAAAAVAMTALLRFAGLARGAVVAGVFVGAVLGATVLKPVAPMTFDRYIGGGLEERQALEDLKSEQGAMIAALRATSVSDVAVDEMVEQQRSSLEAAETKLDEAQASHRFAYRWLIVALSACLLVAAMPRSWVLNGLTDALFASLWTVLASGAIVGGLALFAFKCTGMQAIALAMTFAVCGAPAARPSAAQSGEVIVGPADAVQRLVLITFFLWLTCLLAGIAFFVHELSAINGHARSLAPALPAGIVLGALVSTLLNRKWRTFVLAEVITPTLAAMLVVHLDMRSNWIVLAIVFALVIGGDGRWLGLTSAMRWLGWPWRAALLLTIPLIDAAALQLAMAGLFASVGLLYEGLLAAAVLGAIVCDLTYPLRPRLVNSVFTDGTEVDDDPDEPGDQR